MTTRKELTEAEKMALVPGIEFITRACGERAAKLIGSGLEVWEVMERYRFLPDREQFHRVFDWLTDAQLDAAFTYARLFPEEIAAAIRAEDEFEDQWAGHPVLPLDA